MASAVSDEAAERQKPLASLSKADGATPCFFCCADGTGLGLVRLLGIEWRGPPLPQGLGLLWARSLFLSSPVGGEGGDRMGVLVPLRVCSRCTSTVGGWLPSAGRSALSAAACLGCVCAQPGSCASVGAGLLDTWHQVAPPRPQREQRLQWPQLQPYCPGDGGSASGPAPGEPRLASYMRVAAWD